MNGRPRASRARIARRLAPLLLVAAGLAVAAPAQAAFPGANGKIALLDCVSGAHDCYVATINADGTGLTRITNVASEVSPTWSPNGRRLALLRIPGYDGTFTSRQSGEIWVMNADGSGQVQLTHNSVLDQSPAWSPDGTKIAFQSFPAGASGIYVMNSDGTGAPLLLIPSASEPAWSPDGTKIAFVLGGDIYVANADGTSPARLTFTTEDQEVSPDWSPGGEQIAYGRRYIVDFEYVGEGIWAMGADGSNQRALPICCEVEQSPAWSPDGTKIVFSGQGGTALPNSIWVMDVGSRPLLLHDGLSGEPDWQPLRGPARSEYKNASQFCKAERAYLGESAFRERYGGGANAHGRCVTQSH